MLTTNGKLRRSAFGQMSLPCRKDAGVPKHVEKSESGCETTRSRGRHIQTESQISNLRKSGSRVYAT